MLSRRALSIAGLVAFTATATPLDVHSQGTGFVAPPRSIVDITAILDQQKPDPATIAGRQRTAAATPADDASKAELAAFYRRRAMARSELGRAAEAIADAEQAFAVAEPRSRERAAAFQGMITFYLINRESVKAVRLLREQGAPLANGPVSYRIVLQRQLIRGLVRVADVDGAEKEMATLEAMLRDARGKASAQDLELYGGFWQGNVDFARGVILQARGSWKGAEAAYAGAEAGFRDAIAKRPSWPGGTPLSGLQQTADLLAASMGYTKGEQGRLAEAEVDIRRALLNQLHQVGKYHQNTVGLCQMLAVVLRDLGRFAEMEQLNRATLEILRGIGAADNAETTVAMLGGIANALRLQGKWTEAAEIFDLQRQAIPDWDVRRAKGIQQNDVGYILTMYAVGRTAEGLKAALAEVAQLRARLGTGSFDYAVAEGHLAIGLALAGRDAEALAAFRRAVPVLTAQSSEGDEDGAGVAHRWQRLTARIFEAQIALMARSKVPAEQQRLPVETFPLADSLRGRSVAVALAASSARTVSQDRVLAELARREQDLRKQLGASAGLLNNLLVLPPEQRDDKTAESLRRDIARLREEHGKARIELGVRFPAYVDLIDPKPASVEQVRAALKPDEAFLSFYFGTEKSFVWAIPKMGPATFAMIDAKSSDIDAMVRKLRESLEPNVTSVADIPAFDVALAHELYTLLLKPIEATWRPARGLVVATNGALGLLPLGVLPTAPVALSADTGAAFTAYRSVPWLARSHAVSLTPSAAAFRTLRALPAGATGRQPLIGFGDPFFNREQATEAEKAARPAAVGPAPASQSPNGTPLDRRSAPQVSGLSSATLASLPALPDTADELRSVAQALRADGSKVLNLGKAASEENVMGADLAKYRVVAFATHGLVPGELDGLTQPALALSAPEVAGGKGDGLLTLEKILTLKLDADWVVLSACNTGAGNGAGAEAASGLGQAFFYAGTRAILVTNWSVHSQSARDLVADLFLRQTADPTIGRDEALRQAMMGLLDGKGFTDPNGKTQFTYGHPLFWAPYTIIGDGG